MEEILELLKQKRYLQTTTACDNLLKKKPLGWDNKYDVLIIKAECQFYIGNFSACRETLTTAQKIKKIYNSYMWQGLLEWYEKADYIGADEYLKEALNLAPYHLEKERGKILLHLAALKSETGHFIKAKDYFSLAMDLIPEEQIEKERIIHLIYMREFERVILLMKTLSSDVPEDEIIITHYARALRLRGYPKKALNKLYRFYQKHAPENFFFLIEYFYCSLSGGNYETAQFLYSRIKATEISCLLRYETLLMHHKNGMNDKKNSPRVIIQGSLYRLPPAGVCLPDAVYSLLVYYKLLMKTSDIHAKKNFFDHTLSKIAGYLKENNVGFFRFSLNPTKMKKLIDQQIPFIMILESPEKLNYHLVIGYEKQSSNFIAQDNTNYNVKIPAGKEDRLSACGLIIADTLTLEKAKKVIADFTYEECSGLLDEAAQDFFNVNHPEAIEKAEKVLQILPAFPEAFSIKFSAYINEKKFEEAEGVIQTAKTAGLTNRSKLFNADVYYYKGELNKAKRAYKNYLSGENSVYALKTLARIYNETNDYKNAREYAKKAYNLNPFNRDSIILVGIINTYLENYSGAWEYFYSAMEIYEDSLIYDHAGWAATMQEDWKKGQDYFNKSLKISPDNSYAYYQLGYIYRSTGNSYQAIGMLEKSIRINDQDKWAYSEIGNNYELLKQHQKAIQCFQRAIELGADNAYSLAHIGSNYGKMAGDMGLSEKQRLNLYDKAIDYLSRACEANPGYIWAIEELTYQLRQKGDNLKQYPDKVKYTDYYQKAIKYLKQAIKINPHDSWLYNEMGYAYESIGDYTKAIVQYKRANNIKNNDYSLAHIGFCYRNLHNPDRAISYFKKAIDINTGYFWAISEMAYCYELKKKYNQALKMYFSALAIKPDDPYSSAHVGYIYLEKGARGNKQKKNRAESKDFLNKAIYFLKRAVDIDTNYLWALSELGYALRLVKRFKEAALYLEKATRINTRDEWIFNELGYCYEQSGEYQKASDAFVRVIELDMNNSYAYAHLGHVNRLLNNINKAILYLIKSTRLNPQYLWAITELGVCFREKGWYKTALALYRKSVRTTGRDSWLLNDIGYCYEQLGKYDEAERFYMRASEINVNDEYPLAHLGAINILRMQYDEAEYYFKKALNLNPNYVWAHSRLAEVYERKNNYSGSIDFINKLIHVKYQNADLRIRKAYYYRKMGEYEKALHALSDIKNASSIFEEAVNYWLMKDMAKCERRLNSIPKLDKKYARDTRFWEKKAVQLLKNEETQRFALMIVDRALEIDGKDFALNLLKGDILSALNKKKNALHYYNKSLAIDDKNYLVYEKLAQTYCEWDNEKALMYADKARVINPNNASVQATYAKTLYIGKKQPVKKILKYLQRALALNSQEVEALFLHAQIFFDMGFFEKALPFIEKYLILSYKGVAFLKGITLKTHIKKALTV